MSDEDPQYGEDYVPPAEPAQPSTHAEREQAKLRQQTRAPRDRQLTHARRDR